MSTLDKIPAPRFIGLNNNSAKICITFIDGNVSMPSFKFDGLAIDGDGSCDGIYIAALQSLKNLADDEIKRINEQKCSSTVQVVRF